MLTKSRTTLAAALAVVAVGSAIAARVEFRRHAAASQAAA